MDEQQIITATARKIKALFENDGSGHDWWHIYRVWQMARRLARHEGGNLFVTEMAALLHDVADWKLNQGIDKIEVLLSEFQIAPAIQQQINEIVDGVSFRGAGVETPMDTLEGKIVQDADRLDAIGAIGIARTFAFGGNRNRLMYDPSVEPQLHQSFSEYQKSEAPTINHFYEKLLLLKDRMQTETAKTIAQERHNYMLGFLDHFFYEWNSTDLDIIKQ